MKILLAYQSGLTDRSDPYINLVPTGLCYLHACLQEAGFDSMLANFSAWPTSGIKNELLKFRPDIIGISQWTHNRDISLELAGLCRNILPDSTIIMGGGHATFCYEDVLKEDSPVDIVVIGEGETTLLELADRLSSHSDFKDIAGIAFRSSNNIVITRHRESIHNLDTLPLPARYLKKSAGIDLELQAEFIVTTRGCPSACHFCSSPAFWDKKVRFRSPDAIFDEIQYIRQQYGIIYFSIRDDTFTADRNRVLKLCSLLEHSDINLLWNCQSRVTAIDEELVIKMKRAGCECIQLGIESGSPDTLLKLGKKITPDQIKKACTLIHKIGINLSVYLISDIPGETAEDIKLTIDLIRSIQPDHGYVSPLAYFPGTHLYRNAVDSGIIPSSLFSNSSQSALYVTTNRPGSSKLLKELSRTRHSSSNRFKQQKQNLGYCYTTNVIAMEWYRSHGEYDKAEQELLEITETQPDNPWGWFLLGDLYTELGKVQKGQVCYTKVLEIVPKHNPSIQSIR